MRGLPLYSVLLLIREQWLLGGDLNKQRVGTSKHPKTASPLTGLGLAIASGEECAATTPVRSPLKSDKFSYPHAWEV